MRAGRGIWRSITESNDDRILRKSQKDKSLYQSFPTVNKIIMKLEMGILLPPAFTTLHLSLSLPIELLSQILISC
jgi:hypothetical protein